MAYTYRGSLVARAIKDFIDLNKDSLGVKQVFYGDQQTFAKYPSVCVEPAITTRELSGMPYQTDNLFTINILMYFASLQGTEMIQEVCDDLSESLADALNKESIDVQFAGGTRFGGIIISGHVSRSEYGYKMLGDKLVRANRLIWIGMTKTRLVE